MNRALLKKIFKLTNFSDKLSLGAALVYSIGEMRQGWDGRRSQEILILFKEIAKL